MNQYEHGTEIRKGIDDCKLCVPNIKDKLREEFKKWYRSSSNVGSEPTSDWWLSKFEFLLKEQYPLHKKDFNELPVKVEEQSKEECSNCGRGSNIIELSKRCPFCVIVPESIEFKRLIPEEIDVIFDIDKKPLCSRQALVNLIKLERQDALQREKEKTYKDIEKEFAMAYDDTKIFDFWERIKKILK